MSVARFVADQRTMHRVPHTVTCAILGHASPGSTSGSVAAPPAGRRRAALDARVRELFEASGHLHRLAPYPR